MPLRHRRRRIVVMGWIRRLCVPLVLVILAATVLEVGALGAVTNRAKRGAVYQGTGRQPNWPHGYFPGAGTFSLQFRVASDRRHVTQIWAWNLNAFCGSRNRYPATPNPMLGSAPIRRDGTFQVDLKPTENGALSPVRVVGRFVTQDRASGTVRYRGHYRYPPLRCNADGTWTARVKPPPPPGQQFTGTTSQGTRVTFERTIERQPRVMRFDFGWLSCGTWTQKVATGPLPQPGPPVQFSLPVRHGSFSGTYYDYGPDRLDIAGRIDANNQARGTVRYQDRTCDTGAIAWTAHPAAQRTAGLGLQAAARRRGRDVLQLMPARLLDLDQSGSPRPR